jgi:hypothetical protein
MVNAKAGAAISGSGRGTTSSVSVISSPILESLLLPQHGQDVAVATQQQNHKPGDS